MKAPWLYVSRPLRVSALQWTGDNLQAVQAFCLPASPFYAPPVVTTVFDHPATLRVRVRDEIGEEKYPALGPQWKDVDVPLGAWIVRRSESGTREVFVLTRTRFDATYQEHPSRVGLQVERLPAADEEGSTVNRS